MTIGETNNSSLIVKAIGDGNKELLAVLINLTSQVSSVNNK